VGGEVWSKAVDSSYNVQVMDCSTRSSPSPLQPESFKNIWNLRGVLSNAYCRVKAPVEAAPPA
jgi:sulfite oxidase